MKITETQLRRLIQESLQEMELSSLEEEIVAEQAEDEDDGADLEEQVSGMGMGGMKSGGTGFAGGRPSGASGGLGKLGPQFKQMVAKAKAGDEMAKKNVMAVAKANPTNAEMQAAVAELGDMASMASNPFKPTKTGFNRALGMSESVRKVIRQLVKEALKEEGIPLRNLSKKKVEGETVKKSCPTEGCKATFKVPVGKTVSATCPGCKKKIKLKG